MTKIVCSFCNSKMDSFIKTGKVLDTHLKADFWICSNNRCKMEFIKDYDKVRTDFLKTLAKRAGGSFFTLDQLPELAKYVPLNDSRNEALDILHLWHFPPLFIMLALLFAVEWYLRRRHGQP